MPEEAGTWPAQHIYIESNNGNGYDDLENLNHSRSSCGPELTVNTAELTSIIRPLMTITRV